ncbi:PREDICTED: alkylated DNA repair protein alkB homolog 8 [Ceratosolen solmsi marchali]|uniref:Alkylated DNA repair protein alkB homolog 8 n=1 Tax=Ceratosolen solmsi marchali TaxID=326594 RepID=A0AAJ6YPM5_9HYME|nr:PREDICTED: alkylated DNA repair protein alkB homolog 8 [Ceratosolen solmsi marchali]
MDTKTTKFIKKCQRKQKRAQHRLVRDLNIEYSKEPTQYLAICNAGLVTGLQREVLEQFIEKIIPNFHVIMPPGKSYCFIDFLSVDCSKEFYDKVHGNLKIPKYNIHFYLLYIKGVNYLEDKIENILPPGSKLWIDFITPEQESMLIESIDWEEQDGNTDSELKHRTVKHFGYKFQYDNNLVDINYPTIPIPKKYEFLQKLFEQHGYGYFVYDQITVNKYLPGQGIPSHIDTHSVFEDPILSLSLGSPYIMDFKYGDKKIELDLPVRSLLVLSGEARYAWSHGICPRHNDTIKTSNGFSTRPRGTRISFTFRKIRKDNCTCIFNHSCDNKSISKITKINNSIAAKLEKSYVHKVYEEISDHFNETRYKQWPNVTKFIENIETGSFLLDVGCGNGKYLFGHSNIFKIGCDYSRGLAQICQNRGFQIVLADSLKLPYKSNLLDVVLCIAVIHHFTTSERRKQAISEIVRVLRLGGHALIYVWAKEQNKNYVKSKYLKCSTKSKKDRKISEEVHFDTTKIKMILPIHENRTEFTHSDMLVPWKHKNGEKVLRFYHVFEEGELEHLCSFFPSIRINDVYYDQGNWCVVLEKL